jgi:hypothetical protein
MRPVLAVLLSAAMVSAAAPQPGESCATLDHHEFDFVIGNWLVRDSSGRATGTATIARAYGGCVLIETRLGVGRAGESLGIIGYLPEQGHWHRDFLAPGGGVLSLEGERDGAAMVMTGRDYPADGPRMHRVAWTPTADGAVEERWQTSADAGRSWQVRSYGVFHRIAE